MMELTGEGRACIPVGLWSTEQSVFEKCVWKVEERRKNLTGPGPGLHSNAYRSLPGGQVISSSYFHVFVP